MDRAHHARDALLLATFAVAAMVALMLFADGGPSAVAAIAGTPFTTVEPTVLRLALACDTLLPIGYGAGFCLLAFTLAEDALAAVTCLFALAGVTMDFVENGAVVAGAPVFALTVAKYGLLGVTVFLLGTMLGDDPIERLASLVARFATPFFLAFLLSGLGGEWTVWPFATMLMGSFALLALVAHRRIGTRRIGTS